MNKVMLVILIVVYAVLAALMVIPALLWREPLDTGQVVLLVLIPLMLVMFIRFNYKQTRFKKINSLLFDQCDPEAYIRQTWEQLAKAEKRVQTAQIQVLRVNLNAGLQAVGRYTEALAAMPDAAQFKNSRMGRLIRIVYHHNNAEAFLELGNVQQADMALAWLKDAVGTLKGAGKQAEHLRLLCRMDEAKLNMARGRFDGAEAVFREAVDKAQNNYQRVSSMLELGRVHAHLGDRDKARKAFEFVIAHGNRLHCVQSAKELLASMSTV